MEFIMIRFLACFLCLFVLTGCQDDEQVSDNRIKELEEKINKLQNKIIDDEKNIQLIQDKGVLNSIDLYLLKSKFESSAYFTPSSKGYAPVWTSAGNLLVSLYDIKKYANGYKLYLRIGNPTLATFSNVKLKSEWNKAYSPEESYGEWQKKSKSSDIALNYNLMPGKWNTAEVVISPAKEEETGSIKISIDATSISLYSRQ